MKEVQTLRRRLVRQIKALSAPRFHDMGYRKVLDPKKGIMGGTRPMRGVTLKTPIALKYAGDEDEVIAITEDGVMVGAHGGGCVTWGYGALSVEDLALVHRALAQGAA